MSEEAEMIILLWEKMDGYISPNDKVSAAHQMLETFFDGGHDLAVEELAGVSETLDESLGTAAEEWR